jgi:hypothetical protein
METPNFCREYLRTLILSLMTNDDVERRREIWSLLSKALCLNEKEIALIHGGSANEWMEERALATARVAPEVIPQVPLVLDLM